MSPERLALRAAIDRAVRERVEREDARFGPGCRGCGMALTNWTPGCETCWDRHDNWRSKDSDLYDVLLHRAVLRFSQSNAASERARRMRSPEMVEFRRRKMTEMHREGTIGTWLTHRQGLGMGRAA